MAAIVYIEIKTIHGAYARRMMGRLDEISSDIEWFSGLAVFSVAWYNIHLMYGPEGNS